MNKLLESRDYDDELGWLLPRDWFSDNEAGRKARAQYEQRGGRYGDERT